MELPFTYTEKRQSYTMFNRGSLKVANTGQFTYMHSSPAATQGPHPSPVESEILKEAEGMTKGH